MLQQNKCKCMILIHMQGPTTRGDVKVFFFKALSKCFEKSMTARAREKSAYFYLLGQKVESTPKTLGFFFA